MFRKAAFVLLALLAFSSASRAVSPLPLPNLAFGSDAGRVNAMVALPDGSLIIGGDFAVVNAVARPALAHINVDGTLDGAWNAGLTTFDRVDALLLDGNNLYVGGSFSSVNGVVRSGVARISAVDASLDLAWDAQASAVTALAIVGSELVIGGGFTTVGGAPRRGLAKVSLATGAVSSWSNNIYGPNYMRVITALAVDGPYVYFSGDVETYYGGVLPVGAYRVAHGASNSFDTSWGIPGIEAYGFAFDASWVYLGGDFASVGGVARDHMARVSRNAGAALDTSWHPVPNGIVRRIALDGAGLVTAGTFTAIGANPRGGLAEVDLATGEATAWNPSDVERPVPAFAISGGIVSWAYGYGTTPSRTAIARAARALPGTRDDSLVVFPGVRNGSVYAIEFGSDGRTYFGGRFQGVNGLPIAHLARLNADGTLDTAWRPNPDGPVRSFAATGATLLAAGDFTRISGVNRGHVAKYAFGTTPVLDPLWMPQVDGNVNRVLIDGADAYVGGTFGGGAFPHVALAKIPLAGTGVADPSFKTPFFPGSDVRSLAVAGGAVFAGGVFPYAPSGHEHLVKLSAADGSHQASWVSAATNVASTLIADGPWLYVGGHFQRLGGLQQAFIARIDAATGAVDPAWMPNSLYAVESLALRDGVLYVPSNYVNGVFGGSMAAVWAATGNVDPGWTIPVSTVNTVALRAGEVWAGLSFTDYRQGLAAFPASGCGPSSSCATPLKPTTTTLTITHGPFTPGEPATLTATVTSPDGTPGGTVYFYSANSTNGVSLGSATIAGTPPVARITVSANDNLREVEAIYRSSSGHAPSRSAKAFASFGSDSTPHAWDGDTHPDILYRNTASGATYIWHMNGLALASDQFVTTIDPSWRLIGHGDFDVDGKNDMVWRNEATGTAYVWYMVDGVFQSDAFLFTVDPIWKVEAVADFNADGRPDFLFRHQTSGAGFIWYFDNTTPLNDQFLFSIDNSWIVENVGDFNNDGYPDFFFRNTDTGIGFVWYWDGAALGASNFLFSIDSFWQVVQIADWNGDGKMDLVFRNANTGVTFVWYTNGTSLQGSDYLFQIDPSWEIVPRP